MWQFHQLSCIKPVCKISICPLYSLLKVSRFSDVSFSKEKKDSAWNLVGKRTERHPGQKYFKILLISMEKGRDKLTSMLSVQDIVARQLARENKCKECSLWEKVSTVNYAKPEYSRFLFFSFFFLHWRQYFSRRRGILGCSSQITKLSHTCW